MPNPKSKRRKPLTCPKCGVKFSYSAKTAPIARLRSHIAKKHPSYSKSISRKAQKTKRESQLDEELQYTDDMFAQSLMDAGIPIRVPRYEQVPYPYQPVQHESIVGAILTGIKLAQLGYGTYKTGKAIVKKAKSKKASKK